MTGFSLASLSVAGGMLAVGATIKDSIETTLNWGETIHKVALESGQTTEETSRMAVVFGDFGVDVGSLNMMVKALTREGLTLNLETIKQLSTEYNAITDPVQRNEFAFKNFGRSAMQMNIILSQGPEKLQALANAADGTGKVLSESAVAALEETSIKMHQLNDKVDGLKIAIGMPLVDGIGIVIDFLNNLSKAEAGAMVWAELHTGIITQEQAAARIAAIAHGELSGAIGAQAAAVKAANPQHAAYQQTLTTTMRPLDVLTGSTLTLKIADEKLAEATQKLSDANVALQLNTDSSKTDQLTMSVYQAQAALEKEQWAIKQVTPALEQGTLTAGIHAGAIKVMSDAYLKLVESQKASSDAIQVGIDSAAMSTVITDAAQKYGDTMATNADKITKLRTEIDKLTASNGHLATATNNSKYSVDQMDLANNKVLIGSERFQIATDHLAQAHQHAKESAEHYATRLLSLQVAQQSAGDSWQAAQIALDKMNGSLGKSGDYLIDNSKKIGEDQAALDKLTDANSAAEAAVGKATAQFILQQMALDAKLTPAQTLLAEKTLGLVSEKEYNLAMQVMNATKILGLNADATTWTAKQTDMYTQYLAGLKDQTVKTAETFAPFKGTLEGVGGAAHHTALDIGDVKKAEDSLYDKNIKITTDYINNTYGSGGVGYTGGSGGGEGGPGSGMINPLTGKHYAGGADFVVPAGYPNDSYPMRVQSGEHVTVTPAGQARGGGGSSTTNVYINDKLAASLYLESMRREKIALHESLR